MNTKLFREITAFGLVSTVTLVVDLSSFLLLVHLNWPVFMANISSSTLAALLVYLASSKYAFLKKTNASKGAVVVVWYLIATAIWSVVIQILTAGPIGDAFISKLLTIPISFLANFVVSKLIIQRTTLGERG